MLNKEEELGCLEILKQSFPDLKGRGLVIGLYEFLMPDTDLQKFVCYDRTPKEAALDYIKTKQPYIVLDETEGYKCIFLRGNHIKAQYDVTNSKMMGFVEEHFEPAEAVAEPETKKED